MMDKHGFTIVELVIATLILTSAILGMGASAGYMLQAASGSGVRSEALQAVEGRISQIVMDPRYLVLDSLYSGTETGLPGLEGHYRVTNVTHYKKTGEGGRFIDYKTVNVSVSGPGLAETISRTTIVGSP
jgi:type II secretory pathway pseudopilin PulG